MSEIQFLETHNAELRNDLQQRNEALITIKQEAADEGHEATMKIRELELKNSEISDQLEALEDESGLRIRVAVEEAQQVKLNDVASLEGRNEQLIKQLEARDYEFQSTLSKLEEMRRGLSTVNEASMQATVELEARYETLCEQLQIKNEQLRDLELRALQAEANAEQPHIHSDSSQPKSIRTVDGANDYLSYEGGRRDAFKITIVDEKQNMKDEMMRQRYLESSEVKNIDSANHSPAHPLYQTKNNVYSPLSDIGSLTPNNLSLEPFSEMTGQFTPPVRRKSSKSPQCDTGLRSVCLITPSESEISRCVCSVENDEDNVRELWGVGGYSPDGRRSNGRVGSPMRFEEVNNPKRYLNIAGMIDEGLDGDESHSELDRNSKYQSNSIESLNRSLSPTGRIGSYKVPLNPFKDEPVAFDKSVTDARDTKIFELMNELKMIKCTLQNEKDAHCETEHDFEMRLEILLDQIRESKKEIEANKKGSDSRGVLSVEAEADRINDNIKRRSSEEVTVGEIVHTGFMKNNKTIINVIEDSVSTESVFKNCTNKAKTSDANNNNNFILTKPKIPALKEAEKENLYEIITSLKSSQSKTTIENEALSKNLRETNALYSALLASSNELQKKYYDIELEREKISYRLIDIENEREKSRSNTSTENSRSASAGNMEDFYPSPVSELNEYNTTYHEVRTYVDGSQISARATDSNVPIGNEYFVVQKRDTEFLSIPFDSLNDMLPAQILQLLISYKLELANVSRELEDCRNELNRVKRINIMNALPVPALRRASDSSRTLVRPQSGREQRGKYAEKEVKSEKIGIREAVLSSTSISANANRFSSDMFKSTANLMRFKSVKMGPGSVVGSVAGSISSFLGGSAVGDDLEDYDDDESQDGSVHSSAQSSVKDGRRQ